jgi:hypothetical protein
MEMDCPEYRAAAHRLRPGAVGADSLNEHLFGEGGDEPSFDFDR